MIEEQQIHAGDSYRFNSNILYMCKVQKESLQLHTTKTDIGRTII